MFEDAGSHRLALLLEARDLRPLATAAMRAELVDVIGRPKFALTPNDRGTVLARHDAIVALSAEAPDCRLACRDPDDRKFLDLAVSRRTGWPLSKDRALLAARRTAARRFALRIGTPTDFYRWLDDGRPA